MFVLYPETCKFLLACIDDVVQHTYNLNLPLRQGFIAMKAQKRFAHKKCFENR